MSAPKFSKRHYVTVAAAIASALRSNVANYAEDNIRAAEFAYTRDGIMRAAGALAASFERDNPGFDAVRFIRAIDD